METEPLFSAWPGPLRAYQRTEMKLVAFGCSEPLINTVGECRDFKDAEVLREHSILSSTSLVTFCHASSFRVKQILSVMSEEGQSSNVILPILSFNFSPWRSVRPPSGVGLRARRWEPDEVLHRTAQGTKTKQGWEKTEACPPPTPPPHCTCGVVGEKEPAGAAERLGEMRPDILESVNVAGSRKESSTFTVRFREPLSDTRI